MTSYTASGARRMGDEYQDLQSAEVLIEWLEHPNIYRWVRLETMEGSLDDIQVERADGTYRVLQVKFGTDATIEWEWDDLLKRESGKKGLKPSLLQKWKTSLDDVRASGVVVSEAALLTNHAASAAIRNHLSDSGIVDFDSLSASLKDVISDQLGGPSAAAAFFTSFHFFFKERSLETLEASLQRRFQLLGGSSGGWSNLIAKIRRWINHNDEPTPDGYITLADLRAAALWHMPPQVPENFLVPADYVAPSIWSKELVEPRLRAGGDSVVVVTGSPGAGKSTYLSWLVERLRSSGVPVVRHHYFLSITDATSRRTSWETAADAIIGQLRSSYEELVRTVGNRNPLAQELREFLVAAGHERKDKDPLVVIVDGLDHVWRDTGSENGLRRLFDFLLPVPNGVVVVVGTQDIDIARIPRKLRELCPREQWLKIPVLDGEGVHEWLQHHEDELDLPEDAVHADRVHGELAEAFLEASGGHPLILHFILGATHKGGRPVRIDQVRVLPRFDANSTVAKYYQLLWQDISPEGHQLLHLLAGFPWAWPREGLVQCLVQQADPVRLEHAERAIRHVLGVSRAGVTAFHESLLTFVRALSDHRDAAQSLRPHVINWLTHRAPEYWRWRHEWEERAKNGNLEPLISAPTLDWCVDSLVAGRNQTEISKVVAASGWAALQESHLGVATERHYLDSYLHEAKFAPGVLAGLVWLALVGRSSRSREIELNLLLSHKAQISNEEIEAAAEVAFSAGHLDLCRELLREGSDRWNAAIRRSDWTADELASLERILPSLIAASLITPSEGAYQRYVSDHDDEPAWCSPGRYAKSLARLCVVGEDTRAIREELRFLANLTDRTSFEAVDEIVRLACREGFDPDSWIENPEARRSGLFRCFRNWVLKDADASDDAPMDVSFLPVQHYQYDQDERVFVELAHSYFYACLACAVEGRDSKELIGLDSRATQVVKLLSMLQALAARAAAAKASGQAVGGAWLIDQLSTIEPPEVRLNDHANRLARPVPVAQVVVAIAQDLEELHIAGGGASSLTYDAVLATIDGPWTWERIWIEERVHRRLTMSDSDAARLLTKRERFRLDGSRDYLHTRAEEYATLAQFCQLSRGSVEEVRDLARLAARNLLGHGIHKDLVLFDVLAAIRATHGEDKSRAVAHIRSISPIVQIVNEITDGDETNNLPRELAEVAGEVAPEVLPPYLRTLQRNHRHWQVESCFTDLAKHSPLRSVYDRALGSTLVHEEALVSLQDRADRGDCDAQTALAGTLSYCGRESVASVKSDASPGTSTESREKSPPSIEDYPPEQLTEFVRKLHDASIYGDEDLATWTTYWRTKDPDGLLAAVTAYYQEHGFPHEKETARNIVQLAYERQGRKSTWQWLVAYHRAFFGWTFYAYRLRDVEWIWELVRSRFSDRWLEFIAETSRSQWGPLDGAPGWSIERIVRYLRLFGQAKEVDNVLNAATRWGAGLAANMRLPDPALTPDEPDLPVGLRLLVDRLDCPSRMVQERAIWSLAELLGDADTRDATTRALLDWHASDPIELRSCVLLLALHLALVSRGVSAETCVAVARKANILPSIGADLLLREFGDKGAALASSLDYRKEHSGPPDGNFTGVEDFGLAVDGYLAPIFNSWAEILDNSGIAFSRQWEWEAARLAEKNSLSERLNAHFDYFYRGGVDGPALAINDRLSVVLRSAYMRALHWSIGEVGLDVSRAEIHARRVAVMADPILWTVGSSDCPGWWPEDRSSYDGLDLVSEAVGQAVRDRLEKRDPQENEILLFAAGPVGNRPQFRAEVVVRAFLQSAHGSTKPDEEELQQLPWVSCQPISDRLSVPVSYMASGTYAGLNGDWMVAPLAWGLLTDTEDWLLPDRQSRGLYMPATWLFPVAPRIQINPRRISIVLDDQQAGRYSYWNDELRERHYLRAGSRVGVELLVNRQWIEPHLAAGATLLWIVTLSVAQRERLTERFDEPQTVGTWIIGGSHVMWPDPWTPPPPAPIK